MFRRHRALALLLLPLLAHASAAYGASQSSPTDPSAGSPSGSVYQLPFEKGRAEAAPKGTGGTGFPGTGGSAGGGPSSGANATGSGEPSYYRSENNFGSASKVPGAAAGGGGANGTAAPGRGGSGGNGSGGASGSSGASSAAPGGAVPGDASSTGSQLSPGQLTDSGNTSSAANIGLLLLIAAVATGLGVLGFRAGRLKTQH